jgi:hypothetical protein
MRRANAPLRQLSDQQVGERRYAWVQYPAAADTLRRAREVSSQLSDGVAPIAISPVPRCAKFRTGRATGPCPSQFPPRKHLPQPPSVCANKSQMRFPIPFTQPSYLLPERQVPVAQTTIGGGYGSICLYSQHRRSSRGALSHSLWTERHRRSHQLRRRTSRAFL